MARDVKAYDYKQHEADFIESGVRARLIGSSYVQTVFGDAINLLFKVADGQKGVSAKTRDTNNKVDIGGSEVLTQQAFDKENSIKFTLNLLNFTLGWNSADLASLNLPPDQNGMGDKEVLLTTETKQDKEGKPVVKVTNISKLDLSLSAETLAERQTRLAALIAESKKAMFKFDKKAAVPAAAGAGAPPATHGQPVAREDVPFADF